MAIYYVKIKYDHFYKNIHCITKVKWNYYLIFQKWWHSLTLSYTVLHLYFNIILELFVYFNNIFFSKKLIYFNVIWNKNGLNHGLNHDCNQ